MTIVEKIFAQGVRSVAETIAEQHASRSLDDLSVKELADVSWTRARTLARDNPHEAKVWAKAALAAYEFLAAHGDSLLAESAAENAAALRSWRLVRDELSAA
jgi:hypothetical protein